MERKSVHTYALPSRRRPVEPSDGAEVRSAPPSPRGRGILVTGSTAPGSASLSRPPSSRNSVTSLSSLSTPTGERPVNLARLVTPTRLGYQPVDWSLLAIDRKRAGAKYVVTLLYWPTMTLYAWPFDPRRPPSQGTCYITATASENREANSPVTLRSSLRVLEDTVRTWIRLSRAHTRSGQSSPRTEPRLMVPKADIDTICAALHLSSTTSDQRSDWLKRQKLPEDIPSSAPATPLSTPPTLADSAIPIPSPDAGNSAVPRAPPPFPFAWPRHQSASASGSSSASASPRLKLDTSGGCDAPSVPSVSISEPTPIDAAGDTQADLPPMQELSLGERAE
ncbi:hypothetical protein MSPP1_001131 [Malassezia sp. CBS 17886]|nr:hypothetical protein MSPP1_001131 [Malassezia sp. CBS 17886]